MYPMVPGVFIILQMWKANVQRTSQAEKDSCHWSQLQWYVLGLSAWLITVLSSMNALYENSAISGKIHPLFPRAIKLTF